MEDVQQVLRMKVWQALESYDPKRARQPEQGYVYQCVVNGRKDLVKRRRRGELMIEDLRGTMRDGHNQFEGDRFDSLYLSTDHEQTYGEIEDEELLIPSTLTEIERDLVALLVAGLKHSEAGRLLELERRDIDRAIRSIRTKMADWEPDELDESEVCKLETAIAA